MTVIVPVLNEIHTMPRLLAAIQRQTLRPTEVVIADGGSTDGTREWLEQAAGEHPWLLWTENPKRNVAAGLNVCLSLATSPLVARMDAHAEYADDYLEEVVKVLNARADVVGVGGMMAAKGYGPWGKAIAAVLSHPVGMGGARHRVEGHGGEVDHAFTPTYRLAAVRAAGGFDDVMEANEDFELDARLRRAGGTIWLAPSARATWYVRESLQGLATQMWRYGHFKARTLWLHPDSWRVRQAAPPTLLVLIGSVSLRDRRHGIFLGSAYLAAAATAGVVIGRREGIAPWRTALVVPVVHLSWGAGFWSGAARHARVAGRRSRSGDVG